MYFRRELEKQFLKAVKGFPSVLVTGPRQAGKSTMLRECLPEYEYVTFDHIETREAALRDPLLFMANHPPPVIFDEIQYAPDLLSYIKIHIDNHRDEKGLFVLTGSQIFQMMKGVSESLAGRVAIFELLPFCWPEIEEAPNAQGSSRSEIATMDRMIRGFYPELVKNPDLDWDVWMDAYMRTYLERDVRSVQAVANLSDFRTFIGLLAARAGQLLNLSEVSKECGISHGTAKGWLSILETTYLIHLLRPYHKNRTKRLVKSPKLYFTDTGLLCHLLGIDTRRRLVNAQERGHIFENMVIMDIIKQRIANAKRRSTYFYRTPRGLEVDLLIDTRDKLYAYEIKFAKSINFRMGQSLDRFAKEHPGCEARILCLAERPFFLTPDIQAIHWTEAEALAD